MNTFPIRARVACLMAALALLFLVPNAEARGGGRGQGGGGHPAARQAAAPRGNSHPHPAPRQANPARQAQTMQHQAQQAMHRQAQTMQRQAQAQARAQSRAGTTAGNLNRPRRSLVSASNAYASRRNMVRRRGSYGSSNRNANNQQYNRAIVSKLRSTHGSLARLDHDYQGHRVRAMHAIGQAVQQLSRRSSSYSRTSFASSLSPANRNRTGTGAGTGTGWRQPMSQAQSDARMRRALRTLQGIGVQMSSQSGTSSQGRARGSIQRATRELSVALRVR